MEHLLPFILALGLFLVPVTGCHSVPPLPPFTLKEPGWNTREGQAIWKVKEGAPEIAGEILVATHNQGQALAQFTKNPFPMVIARVTTNSWQLDLPTRNKRYSGHGRPPSRVIWFQLLQALSGHGGHDPWSWRMTGTNSWHLENHTSGECLEGYFGQ